LVDSTSVYTTFVIAFFTIDVIPWILLFAVQRSGGPKEAWYRLRNIPYFQAYILNELDKVERRLVKLKDFHHSSAAHIEVPGRGDYGTPQNSDERFLNPHSAPAGFYNWDDYRPIPVHGREPDVTKNGVLVHKPKCPPMTVHSAYKDDRIEQLHKINVKTTKWKWGFYGLAIFLTLLAAGLAAYYSYYFGINTACAVHAHNVNCG
jgi:hypothetical protein